MAESTGSTTTKTPSRDDPKPHRYSAELADTVERRWQAHWEKTGAFRQPNPGEAGFDPSRPRFYCLDMFPYPSGAGLHVGHPEGYTATDILCRYKRMRGFNVLHPMGWDAFGLPAEQYAIKTGVHPAVTTKSAIDNFRRQLQRFGFSYDWSREFGTIDPDYYRWTQWIFLQIYDAWFDPVTQRAKPIAELEEAFSAGTRPVRLNPDAAELSKEEKATEFGPWASLDRKDRHRVLASYRLAYLAEQTVNWCPKLGTALANEEVIDGRSERGGFPVLRKPLRQWLFRITAYGDRLLQGLDDVDWPEATKTKQTDWIGRSEGAELDFALEHPVGEHRAIRVYTTRPDTLFGATYMVVAPEHPLVAAVLAARPNDAVRDYVERTKNRSDLDRQTTKDKTGVPLGLNAVNPATGQAIPVWAADYVLMGYGHGAIMAVPAHDDRDGEFATKFGLSIVEVVAPPLGASEEKCFTGDGIAKNSKSAELDLDGSDTGTAKHLVTEWATKKGIGKRRVNYKLRDWLFSRQRYWGEPFPIVYDADGLHHPVDAAHLPVVLPELTDYQPEESEEPRPLLAKARDWVTTTAGAAGIAGLPPDLRVTRETNTMPGWAGSCWYYLRFADPKNAGRFVGKEAERYWLGDRGVDLYIGGAEHAVLHLLYARFWHKVLHDLGHVESDEPFKKLFHQGMITSYAYQRADRSLVPIDQVDEPSEGTYIERATGERVAQIVAKMSKSLKNVVNPDEVIQGYGADTFRLYEMYMGPLEASKPWNTRDIIGLFRFLQRAWRMLVDEDTGALRLAEDAERDTGKNARVEKQLHRAIAKVEQDIERLAFNTAITALIELVNVALADGGMNRAQAERFVRILSPFAPHVAEELWSRLGEKASLTAAPWPTFDPALLKDDRIQVPVQILGKVRSRIEVDADVDDRALEAAALADPAIQELLQGKTIRKVIVVSGRLVNIVAG